MCITAENEKTVDYLMKSVSLAAVQSTAWGGKYWARLKKDINMSPTWEKLQSSQIWQDTAQYSHIHMLLSGKGTPVTSEPQAATVEAGGQVLRVTDAEFQRARLGGLDPHTGTLQTVDLAAGGKFDPQGFIRDVGKGVVRAEITEVAAEIRFGIRSIGKIESDLVLGRKVFRRGAKSR